MRGFATLGTVRAVAFALALWPAPSRGQGAPPPHAGPEASKQGQDRTGRTSDEAKPAPAVTGQENHSAHVGNPPPQALPPGVPPITDADRSAAFPDVEGHSVHDNAVNYFALFDQLEWVDNDGGGVSWDSKGWMGGDRDRLWFRTEGLGDSGHIGSAQAHLLYGRALARWWDLVVGLRQDVRPGPAQTWAAVGVQGLAPYWFEVEVTAYVGASGRTHVRLETEYELLLTNRLILQPLAEVEIYGKSDPEHGIGAGLSTVDAGLRMRYEFRREIAPYVGVTWSRKFLGTANFAEAAGNRSEGARLALGVRLWF